MESESKASSLDPFTLFNSHPCVRYQGILGACVGIGNAVGPFLAAAFISKSTWRGLFWLICPLAIVSGGIVLLVS